MTGQWRITITLTREQAEVLMEQIEDRIGTHSFWADRTEHAGQQARHRHIAVTLDAIADQVREVSGE